MHVNVAIEGRNCAPDAGKLIAKWPPCDAERGSDAPWAAELIEHIACCRAEHCTSRSCSRRGISSSRDARLACTHRPAAAAVSKLPAMCACSSGGSSSRSCTIGDAALYSFRVYSRLYSKKRAVERYTASPLPTTPLQSSTAYTALYSFIQLYTALYIIQLYSLYSIQRYTITLWKLFHLSVAFLA